MREIVLFVEDHAHQLFLQALISRLSYEYGLQIKFHWGNVRRGHGAVIRELKQFLRDLQRGWSGSPDLIVVATDANCKGLNKRLKEITSEAVVDFATDVVYAIPDPHIERWLLLDSGAFKKVFGRGCNAPDLKCERKRYKKLLIEAIQATGITPSLGGIEFSDDIVYAMDYRGGARNDASFGRFIDELTAILGKWRST